MSRDTGQDTILSHHALRGVAAFLVLLFHFRDVTKPVGQALDARTGFFSTGFIWVDFFFILSGFILSHVYGRAMLAPAGPGAKTTRRFYVARLARIYPLHLATLMAMVALELSAYVLRPEIADAFRSERKSPESIVQHLTLTHAWATMRLLEWNVPSWSISTEAFAYLVFPLLLPLAHARSVVLRGLLPAAAVVIYAHTFVQYTNVEDQQPLARCLAGFVTGMVLHRAWQARDGLAPATASVLQLAALAAAIMAMHFGWSQAIVVAAFAVLIYATADDRGAAPWLLRQRPLLLLGTLSYSMYMTHWIVYKLYWMYGVNALSGLASQYSPLKVYGLKVGMLLALTMGLSVLAYSRIELPARHYLTRRLAR